MSVGKEPLLPEFLTADLLESECPFSPGKKIKDTHLLVLIPKTVNGEPYSVLTLEELCFTREGVGQKGVLIHDNRHLSAWPDCPWASAPQGESEWVFLPRSGPDGEGVAGEKQFSGKGIEEQERVLREHYPEYREAKVLELVTATVLDNLVNNRDADFNQLYLWCHDTSADLESFVKADPREEGVAVGSFDKSKLPCVPAIARK